MPPNPPVRAATKGWRTPALVVACGCLIALITYGPRTTFGLFIEPMSLDRDWSREVFALAIAIQNILWGVGQPFAGGLADRFGAAWVLAGGGVLYALGVTLMAFSPTPGPAQSRSWALGIATASGSLGQFLFAPLGQAFIAA